MSTHATTTQASTIPLTEAIAKLHNTITIEQIKDECRASQDPTSKALLKSIESLESIAKPSLGGKAQQWAAHAGLKEIVNAWEEWK